MDQAKEDLATREFELNALRTKEKGFAAQSLADERAVAATNKISPVATKEYKRDAAALGRNLEGDQVDKEGKVITRDDEGKRSAARSGELGKLDFLEEELRRLKNTLASLKNKPRDSNEVKYSEAAVTAGEEAFRNQEHLVASAEKLFQQWPDRMARIQDAINKAEEKLSKDKKSQTGDVTADKELEDKTLPELRAKLKLAEEKLRVLVPIQKKAEDTRADGTIQVIRRDADAAKAKEDAEALKREQQDIKDSNSWNKSHRTGGGDFEENRGGNQSNGDTQAVKAAAENIAQGIQSSSAPFLEALQTISGAQQAENARIWKEIQMINSRGQAARNW